MGSFSREDMTALVSRLFKPCKCSSVLTARLAGRKQIHDLLRDIYAIPLLAGYLTQDSSLHEFFDQSLCTRLLHFQGCRCLSQGDGRVGKQLVDESHDKRRRPRGAETSAVIIPQRIQPHQPGARILCLARDATGEEFDPGTPIAAPTDIQ